MEQIMKGMFASRSNVPKWNRSARPNMLRYFWAHSKNYKQTQTLLLSNSGNTSGGSDRPGDIKDLLDMEHLQLNDHSNKASKSQVW